MEDAPPLDEPEYGRWRDEADRALEGARLQADAGLHNWACFAAEQSAQLAMKALLHGLGRAAWGRDLVRLAERAAESGVGLPPPTADAARRLSRHYIPARYPDAHPGGSPGAHYGLSDADEALADAEQVLAFVDGVWGPFVADPLAERRAERERLLEAARSYVERLRGRLPVVAAAVVGSVARGDFNVWSDVDIVVVAERLPDRAPDRAGLLLEEAPAGVQPVGFTPEEFDAAWSMGNRLTREATEAGVILTGEEVFNRYRPIHSSPPS